MADSRNVFARLYVFFKVHVSRETTIQVAKNGIPRIYIYAITLKLKLPSLGKHGLLFRYKTRYTIFRCQLTSRHKIAEASICIQRLE